MDRRFVKIGREKWVDRGPVRTIQTRGGKKTGRFGVRRFTAVYDGELDRWNNKFDTKWYWYPIVFCDGDANKRETSLRVWGRAECPVVMTSEKYQDMSDEERER